jgi:drug/metabolite transporter (DMT)-like permease
MSYTLIATIGGLWAMLMWGTGDWLLSRASKKTDAFEANLSFQLPSLLISGLLVLATHRHVNSLHNMWIFCIASLIFGVAFLTFIRGLATGAVGIVAPASSTYPLFTLVLSAIFLSITFSRLQIIAMVIVVLGVIILAFEKRDKNLSIHVQHKATLLALITALLWGIGNVVQNSVISKEAWQNVIFAIDLPITVAALIFLLIKVRTRINSNLRRVVRDRTTLAAGSIYTVGSIGFYYSSVRVGSVIIPVIVSSIAPLVTSTLSAVIDKEHLTLLKRAGAVIAVVGVILINA